MLVNSQFLEGVSNLRVLDLELFEVRQFGFTQGRRKGSPGPGTDRGRY